MRYAGSNPKSATPAFCMKLVLSQVSYTSFSVFGELGQFRKTERDRPSQIPYKSLAGILLRKSFKFLNSTFLNSTFDLNNAVSLTPTVQVKQKGGHHICIEISKYITSRQVVKKQGANILWYFGVLGQSNRTTCQNSSPNSQNYVDWNTQAESNLKSCCNFISDLLHFKI